MKKRLITVLSIVFTICLSAVMIHSFPWAFESNYNANMYYEMGWFEAIGKAIGIDFLIAVGFGALMVLILWIKEGNDIFKPTKPQ